MKVSEIIEQVGVFDLHTPVLAREILEAFAPIAERAPSAADGALNESQIRFLDGTFGRGGHFRLLQKMIPQLQTEAFDQDAEAIAYAKNNFRPLVESGQLRLNHKNFSKFSDLNLGLFDMMLLDLGVSSPQLDEAARGFSFYQDGPLDMRMDRDQELTAATLVNGATEQELNDLFFKLGEVRKPFRVVRAIVHDRKEKPYETTQELASLIERVDGWHRKGHHPATNYFMALRLAVNDELGVLSRTLPQLMAALKPKGRLAVLSFHSLEDRIVKYAFKDSTEGHSLYKKVVIPTDEESEKNPRSRSAKLRVFVKEVQDERRKYPLR